MARFKLNDKHIAFANDIASGITQAIAYKNHMAVSPATKANSLHVCASKLMRRKEIRDLVDQARRARTEAITGVIARTVAEEFSTVILTVDELDAYHSAVVQGKVDCEEVIPVYTNTYDKQGRITQRTTSFMRVKRPPNIREKQISIQELYKRGGNYAPSKMFGAIGKVNEEGELENVERFILLSTGERIPMFSTP